MNHNKKKNNHREQLNVDLSAANVASVAKSSNRKKLKVALAATGLTAVGLSAVGFTTYTPIMNAIHHNHNSYTPTNNPGVPITPINPTPQTPANYNNPNAFWVKDAQAKSISVLHSLNVKEVAEISFWKVAYTKDDKYRNAHWKDANHMTDHYYYEYIVINPSKGNKFKTLSVVYYSPAEQKVIWKTGFIDIENSSVLPFIKEAAYLDTIAYPEVLAYDWLTHIGK